jgi:hypothetical protein
VSSFRDRVYALADASKRRGGLTKEDLVYNLHEIVAEDRERQEVKDRTRIKVPPGRIFVVDLNSGLATDTYALGPVEVFRGKHVRDLIAKAETAEGFASSTPTYENDRDFMQKYIGKWIGKADLDAAESKLRPGGFFVDVTSSEGIIHRFNAAFWDAMRAVSDAVMVDRSMTAPAAFLKDDTVIGLLMPVRPWSGQS